MHRRTPLLFLALAAATVAFAQYQIPVPPDTASVNTWTPSLTTAALHGAVFDGGLAVGANSTTGADTLSANECQARLGRDGYDNERSPVISTMDQGGWKMAGLAIEWFALGALADGGYQSVTFNQTPLVYASWWRHYAAGADGGQPWLYGGSFSVTGSGGPTSQALMRVSNSGALALNYGFQCFVPLVTGTGVDKVVQRVNKELMYTGAPH